jgi:hypothetical protein
VLGPEKKQHKDWISVDTLLEIQTRRLKKEEVNSSRTGVSKATTQAAEYKQTNRAVNKNMKKDKGDYIDSLAEEAEEAAYHSNMKNYI